MKSFSSSGIGHCALSPLSAMVMNDENQIERLVVFSPLQSWQPSVEPILGEATQ